MVANDTERVIPMKVKDKTFTTVFSDKESQVSLIERLLPDVGEVNPDLIRNITIDNVLTTGIYNDLGLMYGNKAMILVEAQSTWTANILVRFILYVAETLTTTFSSLDKNGDVANKLYGTRKVPMPEIHLYVIYVGKDNSRVPEGLITLSDEFYDGKELGVDIRATVISKASGADIISQYIRFCKIVYEVEKELGRTKEAIQKILGFIQIEGSNEEK